MLQWQLQKGNRKNMKYVREQNIFHLQTKSSIFLSVGAKMWSSRVSENSTTPGIFQPSLWDLKWPQPLHTTAAPSCEFRVWKPWSSKQLKNSMNQRKSLITDYELYLYNNCLASVSVCPMSFRTSVCPNTFHIFSIETIVLYLTAKLCIYL